MGDISLRGRGKAYLASTKTSTREKFSEGGKPEVLKEEKKGIFGFFKKNKGKPQKKKTIIRVVNAPLLAVCLLSFIIIRYTFKRLILIPNLRLFF